MSRRGAMRFALAGAVAIPLAACASGPPPARPPVNIPDQVSTVDPAKVAGSWRCTEINPYPDQPVLVSTIEFMPDGRMSSRASTGPNPQLSQLGMGAIEVSSSGSWHAEGGDIVADVNDVKTIDTANSAIGSVMTSFVETIGSSMLAQDGPSRIDVRELTSDRLVMVADADSQSVGYSCSRS